MLDQAGVLFQRRAKKGLARKEHHDKLWRGFELLPVFLSAQSIHMIANLPGMVREARAAGFFIIGFKSFEEGLQRRFGIDHDALAAGQLHHQIRTYSASLCGYGFLLGEVAVRKHARDLDHAAQLNFSPAPANVGSAQSAHQIAGFGLQFFLRCD